jgi:hypothetical protein
VFSHENGLGVMDVEDIEAGMVVDRIESGAAARDINVGAVVKEMEYIHGHGARQRTAARATKKR